MTKVLVTGAGGFVGTELVKNLIKNGYSVRALVRNKLQIDHLKALGAEVFLGDLLDKDSLTRAATGVKKIFHIAALFRQAGLPDSDFFRVNVDGTRNIIEAGIAAGIEKFIHCSTVGVHGNIEKSPAIETSEFAPGDAYQRSKLEGELLVNEYFKSGKLSGSIIRPAMIYGPRDTRTLKLFKKISQKSFFYVGNGDALVHFVDVRDLADAFRLASEKPEANGEVFIIAGKSALPLNKMIYIIAALFGVNEPWLHLPVKPMQFLGTLCEVICTPLKINPPIFRRRVDFFTKNRTFDSSKANRLLGFSPSKSIVEEIIDIIDSYVEAGMICQKRFDKPATILRTIDGKIMVFDSIAEKYYGWEKSIAIGQFTHELFDTQFPENLEKINLKVISEGKWEGRLFHKTKDQQSMEVNSRWINIPNGEKSSSLILELNKAKNKSSRPRANLIYFFPPELIEPIFAF